MNSVIATRNAAGCSRLGRLPGLGDLVEPRTGDARQHVAHGAGHRTVIGAGQQQDRNADPRQRVGQIIALQGTGAGDEAVERRRSDHGPH